MKILKIIGQTKLNVKNIKGFLKRDVVVSGTSAKVNCPKEYLGQKAYLIILENEQRPKNKRVRRRSKNS